MSATARNVDFSNVKESSGFTKSRLPSGDYLAVIKGVQDAIAKNDEEKTPQYLFTIQVKSHPSAVYPYYCKLQENQLWKLRNIFIAAGKVVPKSKIKVDPNQIVGKLIGITLEDTEWEGREQSQVQGVFPAAELGDETAVPGAGEAEEEEATAEDTGDDLDVEEEPEEPEAEEAEEADPYADLDRNELKRRIKAHQNDVKFRTSQSDDDLRDILKKLEAQPAAASDEEDLDELDLDSL